MNGDIIKQDVDVIVNAANRGLFGGGVDRAIHQAAGSAMLAECLNLPLNDEGDRCPVGSCRLTTGGEMGVKYVIHTVGPVWRGGDKRELQYLNACYYSCLEMAHLQGLQSIAFPCISTGAYAIPKAKAAFEAIRGIKSWFDYRYAFYPTCHDKGCNIYSVKIVCFDDENYHEYLKLMPDGYINY